MVPLTKDGQDARTSARLRRATLLQQLRVTAAHHPQDALPQLLEAVHDKTILHLHVWLVDQAIFGTKHSIAVHRVQQVAEWTTGHITRPERATIGWLLDARTHGTRWSTWLILIALGLGYQPPIPNPFPNQPTRIDAANDPNTHHDSNSSTNPAPTVNS